jgi:phosphoserine phosphatase RsbU/P
MRVLVADDDPVSRAVAAGHLRTWGHEPVAVEDGDAALAALRAPDAPRVGLLDWHMPGHTGVEIIRAVRSGPGPLFPHLVIVTSSRDRSSLLEGLAAGAADYVTKPYDPEELRLRVGTGIRIVELEDSLAGRVRDLEDALARVKTLQGLLVVCSVCRRVRVGHEYWQRLDHYIQAHTDVDVSHGYCPECYTKELAKVEEWKKTLKPPPA